MLLSPPPGSPQLTSRTVFFIGNGVLRLASGTDENRDSRALRSPSWAEYMDNLWSFIRPSAETLDFLSLEDFSRLPAPRQAEWFDRKFRELHGQGIDVAALRLHLLGRVLHRDDRILSNPLLRQIADLIAGSVETASDSCELDVITTNVDLALEQNIARAIEDLSAVGSYRDSRTTDMGQPLAVRSAVIETIVDFRLSARWELFAGGSGCDVTVRLWKLHGCLRDLKLQLSGDTKMTRAVLRIANDEEMALCGSVPMDKLAANLSGGWRQTVQPDRRPRLHSGVFSQSEYFRNLLILTRGEPGSTMAADRGTVMQDEQWQRLDEFRELLSSRPLIFVGYSIPEVDVDVVYALQRYPQRDERTKRWQLRAERERSASADERLRQLGIDPWPFEVPAIGFASIPGKLTAARRHEWRSTSADPLGLEAEQDWRRALERVAAEAWLEPQLQALRSLRSQENEEITAGSASREHRLVIAGLGSIWHAIALTTLADFPAKRRASVRLISVDSQMPGGSGLVPAMVAAAAAGPAAVGHLEFFSNVPHTWSNWNEIEDLCLSAGVQVHPWSPASNDQARSVASVARTSHVILFDPTSKEDLRIPRQRFIMDVQALTDETLSPQVTDWSALKVPAARLSEGFQKDSEEDLLFVDKEADPDIFSGWRGPIIYESGTRSDELVSRLRKSGFKPSIWTAGIASFIRTLFIIAESMPGDPAVYGSPREIMRDIESNPRVAPFAKCGDSGQRYLANLISSGDGIGEGFSYDDELEYGTWLIEHAHELASSVWGLLGTGAGSVLAEPHPRIGSGVLTTIHDRGLLALWQWRDGRTEQVAVRIGTVTQGEDALSAISVKCEIAGVPIPQRPDPVLIEIAPSGIIFSVGDLQEILPSSSPIRRNTLAAGDTVRGAMLYGLWTTAYRLPPATPADIQRIFLASAALASLKCYAGSFVDFLKQLERLRGSRVWRELWGF
jgi:hypothetical protein